MSFHDACDNNNLKLVKILINNGININKKNTDGDTGLHIACRENNYKLVKLLIDNGAIINDENQCKITPFHFACNGKYDNIVNLLIEHSLKIHEKDEFFNKNSEILWDNGYKDIIKSYHNAIEIIYNDMNSEYLEYPYLITQAGTIIDVYGNKFIEPINNNLYLQIILENQIYLVHILVANTFKPNEDKTLIIKHKNHNILDNNVDNLEWVKVEISLYEYMCKIKFLEIPEFLYNSELYKNCLESSDDFEILKKYYKNNLIINSIDDFIHLLYTLRFWCIEKIPDEVYDFVMANKLIIEIYYNLLKDIFNDFYFLDEFKILFRYKEKNIVDICIESEFLNLLEYTRKNNA